MADSIIFNTDDSVVKGRVKDFKPSEDIKGAIRLTDRNWKDILPAMVNNWEHLNALRDEIKKRIKYWKVDNGKIVEMTQTEKDAVDTEIANEELARREAEKNPDNLKKLVKCSILAILKRINYPVSQFKKDVKAIYDGLK